MKCPREEESGKWDPRYCRTHYIPAKYVCTPLPCRCLSRLCPSLTDFLPGGYLYLASFRQPKPRNPLSTLALPFPPQLPKKRVGSHATYWLFPPTFRECLIYAVQSSLALTAWTSPKRSRPSRQKSGKQSDSEIPNKNASGI